MGAKAKASTKKFQKHHLGRELTKRKHDQKKKAIREKSLAKYVGKEGDAPAADGADEDEEDLGGAGGAADERAVFSSKAKLKPQQSAAHRVDRKGAAAAGSAAGYVKPATKKAPTIEDVDVDSFLDGELLDDDSEAQVDQSALDADDGEEEDEDAEMDASGDEQEEGGDDQEQDDAALLAEIEAHERDLANLAQTDPEFYSHLKQHDKELLAFSGEALDAEAEQEEQDAGDEEADAQALEDEGGAKSGETEVLDMASLKALEKQVLGPVWSVRALKKLIRVFRSAVHIGEVTSATPKKGEKQSAARSEAARAKEARFRQEVAIHSSMVYNELVRFVLKESRGIWAHHFKAEAAAAGAKASSAAAALEKHPKWSTLGPVLKAFLGHVLHFLSTLHAETSARMARFALSTLEQLVPLFDPFPKLSPKLLRELLVFWSEGERDVRVDAFLRIRQAALELSTGARGGSSESMLELTLKGMYLSYVRHSKFTSALTLPVIEFMANCVVEIYGLDPSLSYQHAFVYIRQLAIHLRQALLAKKKDSHRAVYNWNFVNSLRVWAKVLAAHGTASSASAGQNGAVAAADNLHALVYPFVQICLGTLTVLPSSRYFPLRFHVIRMLLGLMERCALFVPLAPHLLGVLNAPELSRKPTSSTRKATDIYSVLKASKHVLASKSYQESCVGEALFLLLQYFSLYASSIAFPELILPSVKLLRRAAKESIVIHRVRKQVQQLLLKLEHNASWVTQKRHGVQWAPKDMMEPKKGVDGLATFAGEDGAAAAKGGAAPLLRYVALAQEERRLLDESKADWSGSKSRADGAPRGSKKGKKAGSDDDDDEDEDEAYDRRKRAQGGEDDEDEEDEEMDDGEGEDDAEDGGDDDDGSDDDGEDDEDERPRKKAKAASRPPSAPFAYPADADDFDADGEDQLQVMNFDDDEQPKQKQKKQKQQQKQARQSKPAAAASASPAQKGKGKQQPKPTAKPEKSASVKKEGGKTAAGGKAGDKRKRA